ncbi:alpha/beta hydrolase fold protein [Aspergillus unguis]
MTSSSEQNPAVKVTLVDILKTGFTLCCRLPWVVGTTLLRRWWPWSTYKPPPLKEHLFRHVMTCFGNHIPLSIWQWGSTRDTSGSNLRTSTRYSHIPHLFESVRREEFSGYWFCRGIAENIVQPRDADIVLLHAHGGGYVAVHPSVCAPEWAFLAEVLQKHGITTAIFSLDYTLAPRGVFPKQRDEIAAAYDWINKDMGVDVSKIVVVGDSAGGHLIMSLLVRLHEMQQQNLNTNGDAIDLRPKAAVLISPWVNLYTSHPRTLELYWEERLHKGSLDSYCEMLLRDASPEAAQIYGNFAVGRDVRGSWTDILPPRTLVTAGSDELVFIYDIEDFVKQARADGADVALDIADGQNHTWQCAEAFMQQGRLLDLPMGEDLPDDLMPGFQALAMDILKLIRN